MSSRLTDVRARFDTLAARYEELVASAEAQVGRRAWTRSLGADDPRPPWGWLTHRFRESPPSDPHRWDEVGYDGDGRIVLVTRPGAVLRHEVLVRSHRPGLCEQYEFHHSVTEPGVAGRYVLVAVSGFHYAGERLTASDRYTLHGTWDWESYSYGDDGRLCRIDRHTRIVHPDQVPDAGLQPGDVAHWQHVPEFDHRGRLKRIRAFGPGGWNGEVHWPT